MIAQASTKKRKPFSAPVFKFFASLPLAIGIIVTLMIVLAAGTVMESLHGTDTARLVVYDTVWFHGLLFLLGVNVASAAIDRYPWKKSQTGFVMTHAGIILILTGSFISQVKMVDAQMVIAEGEAESRLWLPEPLLYISEDRSGEEKVVSLKKKPFPWHGKKETAIFEGSQTADKVRVEMTALYPKARFQKQLRESFAGPAAAQIFLKSSFMEQNFWLIEKDPEQGRLDLGPVRLVFSGSLLMEETEKDSNGGALEIVSEGNSVRIPLDQAQSAPREILLGEKKMTVQILNVYKNAAVVENKLIENETAGDGLPELNPAVQLVLRDGEIHEHHTVFANFPDFPTQHGMPPSQAGVRLFYRASGNSRSEGGRELRFVSVQDAGNGKPVLKYQIIDGKNIQTGIADSGVEIETGWMDLSFRIENYYPHAGYDTIVEPEPNNTQREDAVSALQLRLSSGDQSRNVWLAQGMSETVPFAGRLFTMMYGQRSFPAGFRLKLKDFRIEHYAGTNNPASFESDVTLMDDARGVVRDAVISMNKPLEYRGFKIYQSGYHLEEGRPEVSVFSVGRNPGILVQYLGTVVLVSGILTMFFTRKFSTRAGKL